MNGLFKLLMKFAHKVMCNMFLLVYFYVLQVKLIDSSCKEGINTSGRCLGETEQSDL